MMTAVLHEEKQRIKYFSHTVPISDLRPGDHIYAYRAKGLYLYAHHGIYAGINEQGEDTIIHFINTGASTLKTSDFSTQEPEANPVFEAESKDTQESSLDTESLTRNSTQSTNKKSNILNGKIEKRTLDRFLKGSNARLVTYDARSLGLRQRAGTKHTLHSRPAKEVMATAEYYLAHPEEWGKYDFFTNNCEIFCIYCKTGEKNRELFNDQSKGIMAKCLNPFIKTFRGSLA